MATVWYEEVGTIPTTTWVRFRQNAVVVTHGSMNGLHFPTGPTIDLNPWLYHGLDFPAEPTPKVIRPNWLIEQRKTPRRMKRPFPKNAPAPPRTHRRACY